jgi:hypothetical protein
MGTFATVRANDAAVLNYVNDLRAALDARLRRKSLASFTGDLESNQRRETVLRRGHGESRCYRAGRASAKPLSRPVLAPRLPFLAGNLRAVLSMIRCTNVRKVASFGNCRPI